MRPVEALTFSFGLSAVGLTAGKTYVAPVSGIYPTPAAGDTIRLNVSTGATATVYTGDVTLLGFLTPIN